MRWFILILTAITILCYPKSSAAKFVKVAVIDTGFTSNDPEAQRALCPTGHKDFSGFGLQDRHGHGTNIVGIIHKYNLNSNYCQIVIKYYDPMTVKYYDTSRSTIQAFQYAIDQKVDIINYSSYGPGYDKSEEAIVRKALDAGIVVVVPSGNQRKNLDTECNIYPTCIKDKRLTIVGRSDNNNYSTTGYGSIVTAYMPGKDQMGFGIGMTGTSQAAARYTAQWVQKKADQLR